ncbi:aspartyl-tRNA synthetase [Thozetella sp. PMI_491]|nr:aspartyl-tRNA synthetase [Thozetella sp. PMI_491]
MPSKKTLWKEPILKLNRLVGHSTAKNHISKPVIGDIAALHDEGDEKELKKAQKELEKEQKKQRERLLLEHKRAAELSEQESTRMSEADDVRVRYGSKPDYGIDRPSGFPVARLAETAKPGDQISFTARIHHVRTMSSKLAFLVLRQQLDTIQAVLEYREGIVSEAFIHWAVHLTTEDIVHVTGTVQTPKEELKGCSVHHLEVRIETMHLLVMVEERPPVDVYNIDMLGDADEDGVADFTTSNRVRIANRISYLRTPTVQSIFRINSTITTVFRSTLLDKGFMEIHTPKLQAAATESGAEVFEVKYFGRKAFLAQSPQLAKQLCMSADFERVFEIGPVFRAEDSNTHRHLTEFTGMDLEMVIEKHYHEAIDVVDEVLKNIFSAVYERNRKEVDMVKTHFPHEDLVWLDKTLRLNFKEGIDLLNSSGWTDDHGNKASEYEDLSTRAEVRLGELVKEKYKTDYYILDRFPASARPFYTHLDPRDEKFTNSFDIFLRGQEITSGGQRVNNARLLKKRMEAVGIDPVDMEEYLSGFEWGVLPHAGCGIGLERVVMLLLNLRDVRNASLFPRDPKSMPERKKTTVKLRHPEADTLRFQIEYEVGNKNQELPPVEKLIANYGDATNTSWLDDRYKVWRHASTGAAVGYAEENGYALIMGNPLCDARQYYLVIGYFLKHLRKQEDLRPIWLLVSKDVEDILGGRLGWRTMSCVAEERVATDSAKKIEKKQRQAQEAGVQIREVGLGEPVPEDIRAKCDKRIEDWKASRKGTQVHITEVRPWIDLPHRRFLWAETKEGEIAGLIILHQLSPEHGFQIKFALDFPGAPSGTIELLISSAVQSLAKSGIKSVTFGVGATRTMEIGGNLHGVRAKLLSRTYASVTEKLRLLSKTEFREKFGTTEDRVYICYPRLGLGVSGARTLIKFFEDEM